jgi:cytochrome c oxidase cbb3-type subunit III
MSNDKKPDSKIMDHDYDGIKEADNDMPSWWIWSFFLCIIFAAIYFLHYFSNSGPTLAMEFDKEWGAHQARYQSAKAPELSDAELAALFAKKEVIDEGVVVYQRACLACHGDQLQGVVGPNLTDQYWVYGDGSAKKIVEVIRNGVTEKGMPAWGQTLKPQELVAVAAYVRGQRGKQVQGAKAPQGNPYPEYLAE